MSHPVKKAFCGSLAAFCLLGSTWGQSTISFTNSAIASGSGSYTTLTLNKFDTALGSLTGVVVTLNFVTLAGDFTVTATTGDEVSFEGAQGRITLRQRTTNSLGFTQIGQTNFTVDVTPAPPFTIAGNNSQLFTVSSTNVLNSQIQTISSNFWAAYQTAGSGTVAFEFRNSPLIDLAGPNSVAPNNFTATASMTVAYTYTGAEPIPEPSTVAAGAFLTVLAAASYWRRRRSAR